MSILLTFVAAMLAAPALLLAQETQIGGSAVEHEKERLQAVGRAKEQLGLKLQVPESKMALESATEAKWPDAGLGCPEKGRMYAQVVTRGWTVLLKVDGKLHEVHVAGKRAVICPGKPDEPAHPPN
jgi:hypothetical protein